MSPWIVAFILFDMVVTTAVVLWVVRRRAGLTPGVLGVDFAAVRRFSDAARPITREYMQANYSGHADDLPGALTGLLDRLHAEAQAQKLPFDRDVLRSVLKQLVSGEKLASRAQIASAMKKVA